MQQILTLDKKSQVNVNGLLHSASTDLLKE